MDSHLIKLWRSVSFIRDSLFYMYNDFMMLIFMGAIWIPMVPLHGNPFKKIRAMYTGKPTYLTRWGCQRQNGRHFPDSIFKCIIFLNENVQILLKVSLKFVAKVQINYIPALVQVMAWHRPGDKPLYESLMVSLPMHICVTQPQWINSMTVCFVYVWGCISVSIPVSWSIH